jgi:hypothetical protein
MSYSIYDNFLTIADCKFYCNEVAKKLDLSVYDYFFDKHTHLKFPGDTDIYSFEAFKQYQYWQVKFNLTKPGTIRKIGLDEYVSKHHELVFNLTIRGFSFVYICRFSAKNQNETDQPSALEEACYESY